MFRSRVKKYARRKRTVRRPRARWVPKRKYRVKRRSAVRRSLPDYTRVAFRYSNFITAQNLSQTPNSPCQRWRLNSLYDPNYDALTAGQHQPYGYDQYCTFFQKYRVHAVRVRMEWYNPTDVGGLQQDIFCTMWPGVDGSTTLPGTNLNILGEATKAKLRVLSRKAGSAKRAVLKGFYKPYRLLGISKKEYNTNQNFEAFNNVNPYSTPILNAIAYNPANWSDTSKVDIRINFVFYASMFRKKIVDMS